MSGRKSVEELSIKGCRSCQVSMSKKEVSSCGRYVASSQDVPVRGFSVQGFSVQGFSGGGFSGGEEK